MPNRKSRPQKRRRRSIITFEMIRLDRTATEPLHEQLYRQIRDELKSGRFSEGSSRLPSSRILATDRGVSRSTVRLALSKLHAEGYLRSKPGSGTFVANLAVKLLVKRFGCRPVKPNHLKGHDRTAAALLWPRFPLRHADCANFPCLYSSPDKTKLPKRMVMASS